MDIELKFSRRNYSRENDNWWMA